MLPAQREKSKLISVPSSVYTLPQVEHEDEYDLEEINAACRSFLKEHCVRGDIVVFSDAPEREYRNEHRFAYDGEKLISLFYGYIDYGTVPLEFLAFTEFPPAYFSESIAHNTVCWVKLTQGLKEELIMNAEPCGEEWGSWATIGGTPREFRLAFPDVYIALDINTFSYEGVDYLICSGVDYEELFDEKEGEEIAYVYDI